MIPEIATGVGVAALLAYLAATTESTDDNTNMTQPNSFTAMSKARDHSQNNFLDKTEPFQLLTNKPEQFNKTYMLNRSAYMDNAMRGFYDHALEDPNYPYQPSLNALESAGKFYRGVNYKDRPDPVLPYMHTIRTRQVNPSSRIRLNIDSQNLEQTYKDMLALSAYIDTIQRYGSEKQQKHINAIVNPSLFDIFDYPSLSVQNEIIDFFNQNKEAIGNFDREVYKKLLSEKDYPRFIEDAPKRYKIPPVVLTEGDSSVKANSADSVVAQRVTGKVPSKPENKPATTHGKRMLNSRINKNK